MLVLTPHLLLKAFWNAIYIHSTSYYIFSNGGEYSYYTNLARKFPNLIFQNDYFPIVDNGKSLIWESSCSSSYYLWDDSEIIIRLIEEESIRYTFNNIIKLVYKDTPIPISGYPHMCTCHIRAP